MLELSYKLGVGARAPPPEQLALAFVAFFKSKEQSKTHLEDVQAHQALITFQHLQKSYNVTDFGLTSEKLRIALNVVSVRPPRDVERTEYKELAKHLFNELIRRRNALDFGDTEKVPLFKDLLSFIKALVNHDDSICARDIIEEYWESDLKDLSCVGRWRAVSPWARVLSGLARENQNEELQKTLEMMKKYNVPFDHQMHEQIVKAYVFAHEDMEMAKRWYLHPIDNGGSPTDNCDQSILKLCIKRNELDWGDDIFKSMLQRNPNDKYSWNVIFQWAATMGKGVDEIERMMKVMVRQNESTETDLHPDMETINGLIKLANSRNDPYTAERYVALSQKWGFQPNIETYLLQMDYRIKVGDLDGARTAYRHLQGMVLHDEDLPLINKLLVALCTAKRQNYDAIMGLVEDLTERKARFEPDTVAALSRLHLQRGEMDDLLDLLNTYTFHYGLDQRASISEVLLSHCLDRKVPTLRAWETYNILRETFSEISIATRTTLMNEFFARNRSDMATHVFGHMRQQQLKSLRPTIDTYAACLTGIGKAHDLESLEIVHNMIKLDSGIEPDTKLHNALMLAYMGCRKADKALTFWEDIVHSREGPTYSSIQIALRSCERTMSGEEVARDIWGKLKRFEIKVTREIYAAYVGALAGHNLFGECVNLIDGAYKEAGYKPDALL